MCSSCKYFSNSKYTNTYFTEECIIKSVVTLFRRSCHCQCLSRWCKLLNRNWRKECRHEKVRGKHHHRSVLGGEIACIRIISQSYSISKKCNLSLTNMSISPVVWLVLDGRVTLKTFMLLINKILFILFSEVWCGLHIHVDYVHVNILPSMSRSEPRVFYSG